MNSIRIKIHIFTQEVFQYALITYLVLFLLETIRQGFVNYFFNTTILLIAVLISGIVMIVTYRESNSLSHTPNGNIRTDLQIDQRILLIAPSATAGKTTEANNFRFLESVSLSAPNDANISQEKARNGLRALHEIRTTLEKRYIHTNLHTHYVEKVLPDITVIEGVLRVLSDKIDEDDQKDIAKTKRLYHEKLVTLYSEILLTRLQQLQS